MRPCIPVPIRRQADDGFIIVAVLWILAALATLAAIYAIYVSNTAVSMSVNGDRLQTEASVSAALELTAYQLTAVNKDARPSHGAFTFRAGRANVAAEFQSEAARIDLNTAPKELLAGLFATLGAPYANAEYYADRVIGWRTKGGGEDQDLERAAYRTAGLSYGPRGGPFPNAGELSLVLGLPPTLVEHAMPFVTVFSGQTSVDVLDAQPQVLAALPGMTPDRLDAVLNQRRAAPEDLQSVLGLLGSDQTSAATQKSAATRVTVHLGLDNGRQVDAEAVILLLEGADEPFRVLSWHDDFDGPY
jgi:general secretion pathway protein K